MEERGARPDLEAIRSQLRERGYLKGPLAPAAGWLLGGSHAPSSFLRSNALGSLRVAALGGPMVGLLAACVVALANRPHFSQFGRFTLLAAYLTLWYTAALWLIGFAADSLLGAVARRGMVLVGSVERMAARAGLIVGVLVTIYLALLLRAHRAGSGGAMAWAGWAAGVAGALLVGQAIGRFVRIGALAALMRSGSELHLPLAAAGRRTQWVAAGVILLAAAAVFVAIAPWPFRAAAEAAPAARPSTARVLFVGVDGLDAAWLEAGISNGSLPGLAAITKTAARYDVAAPSPRVPPIVWTTIATGRPPEEHGVWGFQTERLPGMQAPVQRTSAAPLGLSPALLLPPLGSGRAPISAALRRARAVWEILDASGIPVDVINWWATWPAAPRLGVTVSDRAYWRFHKGTPPNHDAAPPELERELAAAFISTTEAIRARRDAMIGPALPEAEESLRIDGWHAALAARELESHRPQLLMLYLPGLDIVRGRSAQKNDAAAWQVSRYVDHLIQDLRGRLEPADILLVLGEPGRAAQAAGAPGVLLVAGDRVAPGGGAALTGLDIMPTLLGLMGLPTADDLQGRAILDFLKPGDPAAMPAAPIDSYGFAEPALAEGGDDTFDQEMLDRLRSLGYIR